MSSLCYFLRNAARVFEKQVRRNGCHQINREDIIKGAEEMGMELSEHLDVVIDALQGISGELGF